MSGYFALKLAMSSCTVSSLPQPPMGYVHSLMLAPDAEPEAAVEAAVLVDADLPPQAASAPAALIIPTAFKKERREIAFFIISSPYLSSYRRSFIPDRSCWPYYRKLLSFCPSVAYTIFRKFSCLFRTNIWDTSQILATFTSFAASCSRFVIISAPFVIFGLKIIFVLLAAILKFIFIKKSYFSSIFRCSAQLFLPNYGERHTCQAARLLLYFL